MSRPTRSTSFPHGTVQRYWAGCSCIPCCDAHNAYKRTRRPMLPVEEAQAVIARLEANGMSLAAIAAASGISRSALMKLKHRGGGVRAATLDALLAVRARPFDARVLVSAKRSVELVRRMTDAGHARRQIAEAGGLEIYNVGEFLRSSRKRRRCLASTALGIENAAIALGVLRAASDPHPHLTLVPEAFDRVVAANAWDAVALYESAGLTQPVFSQIRTGRPVGEDRAERLAIALGVSVDTIFKEVA